MEKRIMCDPIITARDADLLSAGIGSIKYSEINKIVVGRLRGRWYMSIFRGNKEIQFYFTDNEIDTIIDFLDYIEKVKSSCLIDLNELKDLKKKKATENAAKIARAKEDEESRQEQEKQIQEKFNKINSEYDDYLLKYPLVYSLSGRCGRKIEVYTDRVVIKSGIQVNSLMVGDGTEWEKIIYYNDITGIQFKKKEATSPYGSIQFETTSNLRINKEDTEDNKFYFDMVTDAVIVTKKYITLQVAKYKNK